jgi:hypothetical protein
MFAVAQLYYESKPIELFWLWKVWFGTKLIWLEMKVLELLMINTCNELSLIYAGWNSSLQLPVVYFEHM